MVNIFREVCEAIGLDSKLFYKLQEQLKDCEEYETILPYINKLESMVDISKKRTWYPLTVMCGLLYIRCPEKYYNREDMDYEMIRIVFSYRPPFEIKQNIGRRIKTAVTIFEDTLQLLLRYDIDHTMKLLHVRTEMIVEDFDRFCKSLDILHELMWTNVEIYKYVYSSIVVALMHTFPERLGKMRVLPSRDFWIKSVNGMFGLRPDHKFGQVVCDSKPKIYDKIHMVSAVQCASPPAPSVPSGSCSQEPAELQTKEDLQMCDTVEVVSTVECASSEVSSVGSLSEQAEVQATQDSQMDEQNTRKETEPIITEETFEKSPTEPLSLCEFDIGVEYIVDGKKIWPRDVVFPMPVPSRRWEMLKETVRVIQQDVAHFSAYRGHEKLKVEVTKEGCIKFEGIVTDIDYFCAKIYEIVPLDYFKRQQYLTDSSIFTEVYGCLLVPLKQYFLPLHKDTKKVSVVSNVNVGRHSCCAVVEMNSNGDKLAHYYLHPCVEKRIEYLGQKDVIHDLDTFARKFGASYYQGGARLFNAVDKEPDDDSPDLKRQKT